MRFVWAVVALFLAVVCAGAGFAQRTVFQGPGEHTEQLDLDATQHYTLIDADVLTYLPGAADLRISGEGSLFAASGRTSDMTAWLSDTSYNHVTLDAGTGDNAQPEISSEVVTATAKPTDATAAAEDANRNPEGSDLWIAEYKDDGLLVPKVSLPADMSLLVATDGSAPAPTDISLKWKIDNSTPWAGPLMVLGGIFLLIGLILYVLGIRHMRKKRGPRRRGLPPLPVTEPLSLEEIKEAEAKGVIASGAKAAGSGTDEVETPAETPAIDAPVAEEPSPEPESDVKAAGKTDRVARSPRRRALFVLPLAIATSVALAGCSPDIWPKFGEATPTPAPTPTVIAPEDQKAPVLLESQAQRILAEISESAAAADAAMSPDQAAERLTGPVLAARETNYKLRAAIPDYAALPAVPSTSTILLPQAADTWPRTFLAIHRDDSDTTKPPVIMMVTQVDPWSDYKLEYSGEMEAAAVVPGLAPASIGATLVSPDNAFLTIAPDKLAEMYVDILANGDQSEYASIYDLTSDKLRDQILTKRQESLDTFNQTAAGTGQMTFSAEPGAEPPVALASLDSGAIVAVTMTDIESPTSTNPDASIRVGNDPVVPALTGVTESLKGFKTTYQTQLFFFVPPQGSTEQVRLLGYSSSILSSEELK